MAESVIKMAGSGFSKSVRPVTAMIAGARMLMDLEDTKQAFVIFDAIDGPQSERNFQRYLNSPTGQKFIAEDFELEKLLNDHATLDSYPQGSLASSFLQFTAAENLDTAHLMTSARDAGMEILGLDKPRRSFISAGFAIHDLVHVLTGYGRDAVGEACVLAFTAEQMKLKGVGLFSHALALREQAANPKIPVLKIVNEARTMANESTWLPSVDFRSQFPMPLADVRQSLNIRTADLFTEHGFTSSTTDQSKQEIELSTAA